METADVSEWLLRGGMLASLAGPGRPDVAFLAVHGTNAEDGAMQGLFELLHIPYTGSGIQASAIAMDKALTKTVLAREGVRVPQGVLVSSAEDEIGLVLPLVVKPNAQGSTVGISFCRTRDELRSAVTRALAYDDAALVEELIEGTEISVPVLCGGALPPVEIVPVSGAVYDFAAKYTPGATEEIVPARIGDEGNAEARRIAETCHVALGCEGATRTDMIVRANGELVVLEVNTLPGMTATSLLPRSAEAAGITFGALCETLVEDAIRRHASRT